LIELQVLEKNLSIDTIITYRMTSKLQIEKFGEKKKSEKFNINSWFKKLQSKGLFELEDKSTDSLNQVISLFIFFFIFFSIHSSINLFKF